MTNPLRADAQHILASWAPSDAGQAQLREAYLHHLRSHADAMWRTCVPAHLTASVLVLDPPGQRVLLTHHRVGDFWVQFGGHCEADDLTLAAAALREGTEESGIIGLRLLGESPVHLDRHVLSAAFGSCGEHLDVRYAAQAPEGAQPLTSDESLDVRWFAVDSLPADAVSDLQPLVEAALRRHQSILAEAAAASASSATSESPRPAVADTPSR